MPMPTRADSYSLIRTGSRRYLKAIQLIIQCLAQFLQGTYRVGHSREHVFPALDAGVCPLLFQYGLANMVLPGLISTLQAFLKTFLSTFSWDATRLNILACCLAWKDASKHRSRSLPCCSKKGLPTSTAHKDARAATHSRTRLSGLVCCCARHDPRAREAAEQTDWRS